MEAKGVQDRHKIFVRAHAPHPSKDPWSSSDAAKWPNSVLIFDTETKIDPTQELTFGCFRRYEYKQSKYSCVEEGLFFADNLGRKAQRVLQRYADNPLNIPETETVPPCAKGRFDRRVQFAFRPVPSGSQAPKSKEEWLVAGSFNPKEPQNG